jgi:hypothetical protein
MEDFTNYINPYLREKKKKEVNYMQIRLISTSEIKNHLKIQKFYNFVHCHNI